MMDTEERIVVDHTPLAHNVLTEVIMGLSRGQKTLPAKFLYDKKGSEIFEKICRLSSYYPTRTEFKILKDHAEEMVSLMGDGCLIIEPGSGSAEKVRVLLRAMKESPRYVPIEISREILLRTCRELIQEFPGIDLSPVCADFTRELPLGVFAQKGKRVIFFPGSTIGNLDPNDAREFLRNAARIVGTGGGLLIGVDRKKDTEILRLAYNDPEGVTAAFNLNLLERLNREINSAFVVKNFRHKALYNEAKGRIEMHLESKITQLVRVNQTVFRFRIGETIHTESSYKYDVSEFVSLSEKAGLTLVRSWEDELGLFSVYYFENL